MGVSISKEVLESAVKQNDSIAGVLRTLGYNPSQGGRYTWIKRHILLYGLDTSHFTGRGLHRKSVEYLTNNVFSKGSKQSRQRVREKILKDNLIPYECTFCGNKGEWMGKEMALELDHINGIPNDHRIENLRFLCPNCHATTDTYCGKNARKEIKKSKKSKKSKKTKKTKKTNKCIVCGSPILPTSKRCVHCAHISLHRVPEMPSPTELAGMVSESSFTAVGRKYNVSANSVVKWCKSYGIPSHRKELTQWYNNNK